MHSKGLSNRVDVCLSVDKNIENTNNQLKYAVSRSEKGTIMFELFLEGHSSRYTISCSCKSSHFLFLIIACLLPPSSIQIYTSGILGYCFLSWVSPAGCNLGRKQRGSKS